MQMYNVILTGHGLVMVFFFMMPFAASGVANLLVALLLGANDLAFPRLNHHKRLPHMRSPAQAGMTL